MVRYVVIEIFFYVAIFSYLWGYLPAIRLARYWWRSRSRYLPYAYLYPVWPLQYMVGRQDATPEAVAHLRNMRCCLLTTFIALGAFALFLFGANFSPG